jgi:arginyl-tRNA synthetase
MKETNKERARREELKQKAKEPLPDVEKLLSELEEKLSMIEASRPLPIELEVWVDSARRSIALFRKQVVLDLRHIEGTCDRIQAAIDRYNIEGLISENRKLLNLLTK